MKTRDMTLIALFAVLMFIGGKISLTVAAVTFSLQSLVCLLAGLLLGVRRASERERVHAPGRPVRDPVGECGSRLQRCEPRARETGGPEVGPPVVECVAPRVGLEPTT